MKLISIYILIIICMIQVDTRHGQTIYLMHLCLFFHTENNVRLVGGTSDSEGRVEILYRGAWGTVCDDGWGIQDANVVCRSLGFPGASAAVSFAGFGQGTGDIVLDDVTCRGTETSILDCGNRGLGVNDCRHTEDAGVRCNRAGY